MKKINIAMAAGAILVLPIVAHAQSFSQQDTDAAASNNAAAMFGPAGTQASQTLIAAEANSQLQQATTATLKALDQLDGTPSNPQQISTPAGVTIAAPAPVAAPQARVPLANLPADLKRPMTINWTGPVSGALKQIAQEINYTYLPPANTPATPPMITLAEHNEPVAYVLQDIGARISSFGKLVINPNQRTLQFRVNQSVGE